MQNRVKYYKRIHSYIGTKITFQYFINKEKVTLNPKHILSRYFNHSICYKFKI